MAAKPTGGHAALAAVNLAVFAAFTAAFCSVERDVRSCLLCCSFFARSAQVAALAGTMLAPQLMSLSSPSLYCEQLAC